MEAAIRDEIETALAALVGQPLRYAGRVVDMATFGFGTLRVPGEWDGRMPPPAAVADYRVHVQEVWRITRDGAIAVGYADYFYPPRGSTLPREAFVARDAPRTRRDDLIDEWLAHEGAAHAVAAVGGTDAGDLVIEFEDACRLESFRSSATVDPDGGSDELWRMIAPRSGGDEGRFVVTAHGVER